MVMEAQFLKQFKNMQNSITKKYREPNKYNKTEYNKLNASTRNLASKITGLPVSNRNIFTRAYNAAYNKLEPATVKIQRSFRTRTVKPRNYPVTAVTKIQSVFRGYKSREFKPVEYFVMSLRRDRRFTTYYAPILEKLFVLTTKTLRYIKNNPSVAPRNIITTAIGVCHINPSQVPSKYLGDMRKQLVYVAKAYADMEPGDRKKYRDRLILSLGERPCLENILEALMEALVEPVFVWTGKGIDPPLIKNNSRYLNNVIAKAISSWVGTKPKVPNNLNNKKQMFWNFVKKRELHVRNVHGIPVYTTPAQYNVNGTRFKSYKLVNELLEYL